MQFILNKIKGDKIIWLVVLLLSVVSLLAVYSSTGTLAYKYQGGNTEYYMIKHFIILVFGLFLMYLAHLIKYTYFSRIFQIAIWIAIPLLGLTLVIGLDLNEAKRVLPLPFGLTFQTSDLAKLTLIMYLARMLTKRQDVIKDFRQAFVPIVIPVLIVCFLILPANFSTAAILFTTSLVLMFIGRVSLKHIFSMVGIGVVILLVMFMIAKSYPDLLPRASTWISRVESFSDKESEENYQVEQAKIAIARGGIIGKMPGNSEQRNFLPHPYSDFIFAIIIEEYGLLGGVFVVFLYMILLFRAVKIVTKVPRNFGAFLTIGVAFSLVFQAMINMGVAVHLLPVTGQPLPLVSMGGTSVWFTSISIGIILSVSKEVESNTSSDAELQAAPA
ncbi:MAG TPA: FtsW/RodA/SpoVE family cell cycle protein [Bacteroidales bacterium]|nr:FtsW/RodA/SpoVE family cell cycle protein [Bacteroidales bacterium]HRX96804.1 FtsW/RodA/SpoVE family cell cycle protein [Bacteroidales bacterium]